MRTKIKNLDDPVGAVVASAKIYYAQIVWGGPDPWLGTQSEIYTLELSLYSDTQVKTEV